MTRARLPWWLVVGLLAGCQPADPVCDDIPLGTTCPFIRGAWHLETSKTRTLCDAALFDEPLLFANAGASLTIRFKEFVATGRLYTSGGFDASVQMPRVIWLRGQVRDGMMGGSVEVNDPPSDCERTWQFTATR